MIRFENVSVAFGDVPALTNIGLEIEAGALAVLVGPSGSGKSTLLRLAIRLVEPSLGRVYVRGEDVSRTDAASLRRSVGYVIQSIGLFPHRTVAQNIATVPRLLGWPKDRIRARVSAMLALVRLGGDELEDRYPSELSGGQAQRVGLARALAADPDILLMDEPFGAVDPITRRELRGELRRIHRETGKTILLVTHDPIEALELATHIVVLNQGRVLAAGRPRDVIRADGEAFVRDLFGGEDLGLKRLRFMSVADMMDPLPDPAPPWPTIDSHASAREALARMIEARTSTLTVRSADGRMAGSIHIDALVERQP